MKNFIITLMIIQVLLFSFGVWQLSEGLLFFGLFNVVANAACFLQNIHSLKSIRDN